MALVRQCFDVLHVFDKTPEQLSSISKAFVIFLDGYTIESIRAGFISYMKRNSKMPTPADIVNIIDPPVKPWKPDWAYYVSLKEEIKRGKFIGSYSEEYHYLRACDQWALDNQREHQEEQQNIKLLSNRLALEHHPED